MPTYPSDLTGDKWRLIHPLFPPPSKRGRPRAWPIRQIVDAIFYVVRGGIAWRMLPLDYPPWKTVYHYFRRWRLDGLWSRVHRCLHQAVQGRAGRHPFASAGIVDSQSVKTTEAGGPPVALRKTSGNGSLGDTLRSSVEILQRQDSRFNHGAGWSSGPSRGSGATGGSRRITSARSKPPKP
jgi:transposase